MIRTFAIALALSVSFPAFTGPVAYAQTPDTDQTDRSEDDWRKSQKKKTGEDVLNDIFQNKTIFGQGSGGYEQNPIDGLPERSRNHLKKERAKALATVDPNNVPDIPYKPSREAQNDPELAEQEKEVWEGMVKDMKEGGAAKQQRVREAKAKAKAGKLGSPYGDEGAGGGKSSNPGQGSGSQQGSAGDNSPSRPTPVRGGSSSSVSDILNKIKGMKSGSASLPSGLPAGMPGGQSPAIGQSPTPSQNPGAGNASSGNDQGSDAGSASDAANDNGTQSASQNANQNAGQSPQDAAQQQADQAAQSAQASKPVQIPPGTLSNPPAQTTTAEILGPLERMKREREQNSAGRQSSAYDFLKDAQKTE